MTIFYYHVSCYRLLKGASIFCQHAVMILTTLIVWIVMALGCHACIQTILAIVDWVLLVLNYGHDIPSGIYLSTAGPVCLPWLRLQERRSCIVFCPLDQRLALIFHVLDLHGWLAMLIRFNCFGNLGLQYGAGIPCLTLAIFLVGYFT